MDAVELQKLRRPLTGWVPRLQSGIEGKFFAGWSAPKQFILQKQYHLEFIPQLNGEIIRKELFHGESNHLPAAAFCRTLFCSLLSGLHACVCMTSGYFLAATSQQEFTPAALPARSHHALAAHAASSSAFIAMR